MKTPTPLSRARRICILAAVVASAASTASPADAAAIGSRPFFSLGGRGMFYRPKDADRGSWSGGAQARLHLTRVLSAEGSVDYRQNRFDGTVADVYPVQASLLAYILPESPLSPYLLAGGGWYYTRVRQPEETHHRFGLHAGFGAEMMLGEHFSVDGSYRYIWDGNIHTITQSHPFGQNFSDNGHMVTAGLNLYF